MRLLEVVGYKESLMLQLVEPPKNSKVGLEPSNTSRVRKAFRGSKGGEACRAILKIHG